MFHRRSAASNLRKLERQRFENRMVEDCPVDNDEE